MLCRSVHANSWFASEMFCLEGDACYCETSTLLLLFFSSVFDWRRLCVRRSRNVVMCQGITLHGGEDQCRNDEWVLFSPHPRFTCQSSMAWPETMPSWEDDLTPATRVGAVVERNGWYCLIVLRSLRHLHSQDGAIEIAETVR